jgi:hypothetical protein
VQVDQVAAGVVEHGVHAPYSIRPGSLTNTAMAGGVVTMVGLVLLVGIPAVAGCC